MERRLESEKKVVGVRIGLVLRCSRGRPYKWHREYSGGCACVRALTMGLRLRLSRILIPASIRKNPVQVALVVLQLDIPLEWWYSRQHSLCYQYHLFMVQVDCEDSALARPSTKVIVRLD